MCHANEHASAAQQQLDYVWSCSCSYTSRPCARIHAGAWFVWHNYWFLDFSVGGAPLHTLVKLALAALLPALMVPGLVLAQVRRAGWQRWMLPCIVGLPCPHKACVFSCMYVSYAQCRGHGLPACLLAARRGCCSAGRGGGGMKAVIWLTSVHAAHLAGVCERHWRADERASWAAGGGGGTAVRCRPRGRRR